jgi:hypothetical protein
MPGYRARHGGPGPGRLRRGLGSLRGAIRQLRNQRGDAIGRIEVALVVPDQMRRAMSQREFLAAAVAWPGLAKVGRQDFRDHLLDYARIQALCGSWTDADPDPRATSRPTRARTCAMGGFSESTWKRCRRWWQREGLIVNVREGRTAEARAMSKAAVLDYEGNDAAVFVLCVPRKPQKTVPAPPPAQPPEITGPPRGTENRRFAPRSPVDDAEPGKPPALRADCPPKPAFPRCLARHPVLSKLSDKAIAWLWRPFASALWTAADWLHAFDYRPDGMQHRKDLAAVRRPAGVARWRFSLWLDAAGRPVASRSQRAAAARAEDAARRAREREQLGWAPLVPPRPYPAPEA